MTSPMTPGIAADRISNEALAQNFADLHLPLEPHEVRVAADRCYFCFDAPCVTAFALAHSEGRCPNYQTY